MKRADGKLRKLFAQVDKQFRGAANDPQDGAAIHGLRTSGRRLAEALVLFDAGDRHMRRSLKKLIAACSKVRDLDVLFETLGAAHTGKSQQFREDLHELRKHAQKQLSRKLRRWRDKDLLAGWGHKLDAAKDNSAIRDSVAELMKAFFDRGDRVSESGSSHKKLHRFRLLAKQMRYSLELTEPRSSTKLRALKGLQDRLGALNDCVVAIDLIAGVRTTSPAITENIERLVPRREQAFRVYWRKTFPAPSRVLWLKEYR